MAGQVVRFDCPNTAMRSWRNCRVRFAAWRGACGRKAVLILLLSSCTAQAPMFGVTHPVAYIPTRDKPVCVVRDIVDGDTIKITCRNSEGNARLIGFDTPETFRPGCPAEERLGQRAKQHLKSLLASATVIAPKVTGKDKYNRTLLQLTLDGADLADIMVSAGLAVYYDGGKRINWCKKLGA